MSLDSDQRTDQHNYEFPLWVRIATLLLISLGVFGSILPGIRTNIGFLFPFRLFLPVYITVLAGAIVLYSQGKIRFPRLFVALSGLVCLGMFSFLYAVQNGTGSGVLQPIVLLTKFILLISIVITLNTRRWVYRGWILLVGLVLLAFIIALFEYSTGWHFAGSQLQQLPNYPPYSSWVTTWYTNVNDFAFFLQMATIPALVMGLNPTTTSKKRISFLGVWTISAYLVVHLGARAVILAYPIVIATTLGLIYGNIIRQTIRQIPIRVGKILIPLFGLVLTTVFVLVPNPTNPGSSIWIRWQLQKAAVLGGDVWGHGWGSSPTVISQTSVSTGGILSPHSWFGALLTDTGLLGLALFLVFYGGLVVGLARIANLRDPVPVMSITSLVALPIAGLGPSNVLFLPMFWIVIGLSISTLQVSSWHIS
ncbi:hypothetical protein [Halobacterium salinarum]|uniref:Uncharacterized protein n=1 Tax=Halobacterium salinarum (strain ATCC 33171 / DSM 3754 / JCM 8978 / NBRC 102687 / NCIMB 764 / 91-R6) TaxID=2597657 RepID=A0A4D6GS88_HALS9|nr:hypothetical protein [Halobacterium salinarum]QCC43996.1 uncharacterized protein HBSAL_01300 [Halobacterium salinarum]TYO71776.1 hypothetical protein APQ99_02412 [Halobacterium salinarum DSM 3754]